MGWASTAGRYGMSALRNVMGGIGRAGQAIATKFPSLAGKSSYLPKVLGGAGATYGALTAEDPGLNIPTIKRTVVGGLGGWLGGKGLQAAAHAPRWAQVAENSPNFFKDLLSRTGEGFSGKLNKFNNPYLDFERAVPRFTRNLKYMYDPREWPGMLSRAAKWTFKPHHMALFGNTAKKNPLFNKPLSQAFQNAVYRGALNVPTSPTMGHTGRDVWKRYASREAVKMLGKYSKHFPGLKDAIRRADPIGLGKNLGQGALVDYGKMGLMGGAALGGVGGAFEQLPEGSGLGDRAMNIGKGVVKGGLKGIPYGMAAGTFMGSELAGRHLAFPYFGYTGLQTALMDRPDLDAEGPLTRFTERGLDAITAGYFQNPVTTLSSPAVNTAPGFIGHTVVDPLILGATKKVDAMLGLKPNKQEVAQNLINNRVSEQAAVISKQYGIPLPTARMYAARQFLQQNPKYFQGLDGSYM